MEKQRPKITAEKYEQIDFEIFLSLFFIGKNLILLITGITVGLAIILSLIMPKKYESTAKIVAEPQKEDNPYYIELRSEKERQLFLETQKEIVVSDKVLRKTVADLKRKKEQDVTNKEIDSFRNKIHVTSRAGLGKNPFSGNGIGQSNTFFVAVKDTEPRGAANAVNALVDNYILISSQVKIDQAGTAYQILNSSVEESKKKTQEALDNLSKFEIKEAGSMLPEIIDMHKPTIKLFPELQDLRSQYEVTRSEIATKQALVQAFEDAIDSGEDEIPVPPELLTTNEIVRMYKFKITDLKLKMNEMKPFYKETSREITDYKEQIKSACEDMRKEIMLVLEGEKQSLQALVAKNKQLEKSIGEYENKLQQISSLNSKHAELRREYEEAGNALNEQMKRMSDSRIAAAKRASGAVNISVIDYGAVNNIPVAPKFWKNVIISIFIGLGIGILLVLFRQIIHPIFVHPRQVEKITGIPVVSTVYMISSEENKG